LQLLARVIFAGKLRQIRKRAQRLGSQCGLVQLSLYREQRSTFHPAMSNSEILRKPLSVVGGAEELVGLPQAVPFFFREGVIAAFHYVVVYRDDIEWGTVGGGITVGKIFEPRNQAGGLRDFVGDFAVVALEFAYKFEGGSRVGEVAFGVQSE
jgi:hypothetical protein